MSESVEYFLESNKARFIVLGVFLLGLFVLAFGVGMFMLRDSGGDDDIKILTQEETEAGKIVVHVDGAINTPGVYELHSDSRVNDLVVLAGGLAGEADTNRINLAAKIADGQKVLIPRVGEAATASSVSGEFSTRLINVNTATEAQLDTLPGIGPVTAGKIIAGRPYADVEELLSKKAVGNATYNKIKDLVTVF